MKDIVVLHEHDNVATSLKTLAAGDEVAVTVDGAEVAVRVNADIPFGHKLAIRALAAGEAVRKYGEIIGKASAAIAPGDWVHVHNVESARGRGDIES